MKLLNVRLGPEDASMVKALRVQGVELSKLVRAAIRAEYDRRIARPRPKDVEKRLAEIHAAHPPPADLPPRRVDPHDRRAVRKVIADRLRRKAAS